MVVPAAERHLLDGTHLFNYYFYWEGKAVAIALGYGSLYNHSASPCARYRKVFDAPRVGLACQRLIGRTSCTCGLWVFPEKATGVSVPDSEYGA